MTTLLKAYRPMGSVTTCGNIGSGELMMTVYPFILRGVNLLGVDSQNWLMPVRKEIWDLLANEWRIDFSDQQVNEIGFDGL